VSVALQLFLLVGGLLVALLASNRAVAYTRVLAGRLGLPTFIVGVVLVSVGTDLPEIANSIAAHLQGQADVNVGDSLGSVLTQSTLVLALLALVTGTIAVGRRQAALVTVLTLGGLLLVALFVRDGFLDRWEGAVLVLAWALATVAVVRGIPGLVSDDPPPETNRHVAVHAGAVLLALGVVGFGATVAVRSLVSLAESVGVPEFVIAFFGASFGTSAPELVVDLIALRRGAPGIAVGDALGSSLVDATLSVGIGPLVRPGALTGHLAFVAALYALVAVAVVGALLVARRRIDRRSAVVLLALYGAAYLLVLAVEA
jgi:cation:H+ antiporter